MTVKKNFTLDTNGDIIMIPRRIWAYPLLLITLTITFMLAVSPITAQDVIVSDGTPNVITIEQPNGTFELTIVLPEGWFQKYSDGSNSFDAGTTEDTLDKALDEDAEFDPGEFAISIAPPSLLEQLDLPITVAPEEALTAFIEIMAEKGAVIADDSFDVPAARAHITGSSVPTGSAEVFALAFEGGTVLIAVLPGGTGDETVAEILHSIQFSPVTGEVLPNEEIRQWATRASGSSQYGKDRWGFMQTTGEPNTEVCGDIDTAWASATSSGRDTLVLEYDQAVIPTQINVYETYTPGSIISIEVGSSVTGEWSEPLPNSVDEPGNTPCPGIFTVDISDIDTPVDLVRITLDQSIGGSWNEIDAVELVGVQDGTVPTPTPDDDDETVAQWADEATGTSQYGDNAWSFAQATGEPNTEACGDQSTAWASARSTGEDMLILAYAEPVIPTQINIYQTFNPGSIIQVEVGSSATGEWSEPLPNSTDAPGNTLCPGVFTVDISDIDTPVDLVRIYLDQSIGGSWNEIDAVELVGVPAE